jgi:hypothetical protein
MYSGGCGCEVVNTQYWWRPLIQRPQSSGSCILKEHAVQLRFFLLHHATSKTILTQQQSKNLKTFLHSVFCCGACVGVTADCIFTFFKEFKACFHYLLVAIVWGFPLITTEWPEAKLPFLLCANPSLYTWATLKSFYIWATLELPRVVPSTSVVSSLSQAYIQISNSRPNLANT